jgi:hypothetical protein
MKKGRVTPNLDSRQTSQNIDFFNTISALQTSSDLLFVLPPLIQIIL